MADGALGGLQSPERTVDGEVGGRNLTPGLTTRGFLRLAAGTLALAACAAPARAADPERDTFDAAPEAAAPVPAGVTEARDDLRDDLGRQGLLTVDKETGAVRFLARLDGFLTTAPSDTPATTVRDYLSREAEAFGVSRADIAGLELSDRDTGGGIQSLEFTQTVDGVPVVDSAVKAHLDDDGRLIAITGGLVPDSDLDTDPDISADEAQAAAARGVSSSDATGPPALVAYTSGDDLHLAWRVLVGASSTAQYDTLVDAGTGEVVRRSNLVKFGSAPSVLNNYPGGPNDTPGTHPRPHPLPDAGREPADRAQRPRVRRSGGRGAGRGPEQPGPELDGGGDPALVGHHLRLPARAVDPQPRGRLRATTASPAIPCAAGIRRTP